MTTERLAPTQPTSGKRSAVRATTWLLDHAVVALLVLIVLALAVLSPSFFTGANLANLTGQWAAVGVLAIAATYLIIAGGFDLSMGATFAFCAVVAAGVGTQYGTIPAYGAAIAVGCVVGLVNGLIVRLGGINPFVATLGTSFIITGIGFAITNAQPFYIYDGSFQWLGSGRLWTIPYSGVLLLALLVIAGLVLSKTVFGRSLYAIGGNEEASRLAGLRVDRTLITTYMISGLAAAVAGIISASQLGAGQMTTDISILFDALTVVIIGGTSLSGGVGAIWRTGIGLAILACLGNGFTQLNLSSHLQDIITGLIVLAALGLDRLLTTYRKRGMEV
ncbi:ribose ABC transporter permease [Nonomuraea cavernae]|uniref:Ribose ABC transporter permease n=1 Tax=Nonomuraea cavernae TaxID=2045107 RepID=A0A918DE95_9ACTN|nr:ribose ABC transporter permease [Nonomuraea cavernae]